MNTTTLQFILDDGFNQRVLEVKTTLPGEGIDVYYEAFESFLLAAGFLRESIEQRYGE